MECARDSVAVQVHGFDGILIGAGDTSYLMWSMLAASALFIALALAALRTVHEDWLPRFMA